jgi:hypothetical protein
MYPCRLLPVKPTRLTHVFCRMNQLLGTKQTEICSANNSRLWHDSASLEDLPIKVINMVSNTLRHFGFKRNWVIIRPGLSCFQFPSYCSKSSLNQFFPNLVFKNSFCTSKKAQHLSITNFNLLMLWKEIISVYIENYMKPINTIVTVSDC